MVSQQSRLSLATGQIRGQWRVAVWSLTLLTAVLLAGCDTGATPLVPTPQPPAATPQLLGITVEPVEGASPEAGTPQPGPTEEPTRIFDESLPAWTVMVYSSADNPAWTYAWDGVNQMEAAGASNQVQVLAAVDWPDGNERTGSLPARYVIRGNNDPDVITSEEAVGAEETNFGDPELLADFISWAQETHPANHYALILDGYGSGWRGCCLDMDPATAEPYDYLSLDEIVSALETAGISADTPLDTIAFSGSMMGQLDVFQAIAPYADYAVASAAPIPAGGWDYQTLLGSLYANPWMDGREWAETATTDYVAYNRDLLGNEFVSMTAVDLSQVTGLSTAVETLAIALMNDQTGAVGAAADARRGAQPYGSILTGIDEDVTAVDLGHAAAILADRSESVEISVAAAR
ncbi:MAG: clostripain-related cysteine peptidase [Chloroflexota bacterium]